MENKQYQPASHATWFSTWSQFIRQAPFSQVATAEDDNSLIEQLLEALQQGDSCIAASSLQAESLGDLWIDASKTDSQIAPFVFEQGRLYL